MKNIYRLRTVTSAEMREIDRQAETCFGIPGIILMENAGRAVADAAERRYREDRLSGAIGVFCGSGNNGGDGFVAARHLLNRGLPVEIVMARPAASLSGDALLNHAIAEKIRVPMVPFGGSQRRYALIVDALLGTGISGEVRGPLRQAIETVNAARVPVISVDLPSGLDADTGRLMGVGVVAAATVTMGLPKKGFLNPEAAPYLGTLIVAEISLPQELLHAEDDGRC